MRNSKWRSIIGDKPGALMLLVLAAMMLLLAISGSAPAAASVSAGVGINKMASSQLYLITDSVQRSIRQSLQSGENEEHSALGTAESLGGQLITIAYETALSILEINLTVYFVVQLTISADSGDMAIREYAVKPVGLY